uniref:5'-deoxynucleotidase HDDC2 n=1 Tax=Arion vulgaris TaxID=1028688 RepID=A0A0B7ACJ9_9EUPU
MSSNCTKIFQFMKLIGQLKQVERTGWVRNKVKDPESVAEHMYRMAMMAFAIPSNSGLDRDKCIKIALVHDMAESMVGDLTPWCGVSKEEKNRREDEATSHIAGLLAEDAAMEVYQLWLEYENQSSPEAKFVKDLDKFEMLFQAYEYENQYSRPKELQEFFDHTRDKYTFSTELVEGWTKELGNLRDASHPITCSLDDKTSLEGESESKNVSENPLVLKKRKRETENK